MRKRARPPLSRNSRMASYSSLERSVLGKPPPGHPFAGSSSRGGRREVDGCHLVILVFQLGFQNRKGGEGSFVMAERKFSRMEMPVSI